MQRLRHIGRFSYNVLSKANSLWSLTDGSKLLDLSGGPLLQTLCSVNLPDKMLYELVGASGGIETKLRFELETEMLKRAGNNCGGILWGSSGSDSIEYAIWALQEFLKSDTDTYIIRAGSYHGNTYLTRWLSTRNGNVNYNLGSKRYILQEKQRLSNNAELLITDTILQLEDFKLKPKSILILEPIPTTGPIFWPGKDYYKKILSWCKTKDIHVIMDEVACGIYRHGWFSVYDWLDVDPPSAVIAAKSLTTGLYPLSCVFLRSDIANFLSLANHRYPAFTYGLNDPAAFIAMECLQKYDMLFQSGKMNQIKQLISNYALLYQGINDLTIEYTDTTIRIGIQDQNKAKNLLDIFQSQKTLPYVGSTSIDGKIIYFFVICLPLDLPLDFMNEILNKVKDILEKNRC